MLYILSCDVGKVATASKCTKLGQERTGWEAVEGMDVADELLDEAQPV